MFRKRIWWIHRTSQFIKWVYTVLFGWKIISALRCRRNLRTKNQEKYFSLYTYSHTYLFKLNDLLKLRIQPDIKRERKTSKRSQSLKVYVEWNILLLNLMNLSLSHVANRIHWQSSNDFPFEFRFVIFNT